MKKKQWGGKRDGAGRPEKAPENKTYTRSFQASYNNHQWLDDQQKKGATLSGVINKALDRARGIKDEP